MCVLDERYHKTHRPVLTLHLGWASVCSVVVWSCWSGLGTLEGSGTEPQPWMAHPGDQQWSVQDQPLWAKHEGVYWDNKPLVSGPKQPKALEFLSHTIHYCYCQNSLTQTDHSNQQQSNRDACHFDFAKRIENFKSCLLRPKLKSGLNKKINAEIC